MIGTVLDRRQKLLRWDPDAPASQQQLALHRHLGMSALLKIKGLSTVVFEKLRCPGQANSLGGPLPRAFLEVYVKAQLTAQASKRTKKASKTLFRFLDLPAQLRVMVYSLLLHVDGPISPSKDKPSSALHNGRPETRKEAPGSALDLLCFNRQVHGQAVRVFYHDNSFILSHPSHLCAFFASLSDDRTRVLSNITLHYESVKVGTFSIVDVAFPILQKLKSLRRLHIIAQDDFSFKPTKSRWYTRRYPVARANPVNIPGMRYLFYLRGVRDIKVREMHLEGKMKMINASGRRPTSTSAEDQYYMAVEKVLAFFKTALADAQEGKINRPLLEEDDWHTKDPFPVIDEA